MILLLLFQLVSAYALEVVRPETRSKLQLRIVRADPDSFGTYSLMNHNGREMILVCANNHFWDNNPKAMIEYRNYYNVIVGYFTLADNKACLEMGKFIEAGSMGVDEQRPFIIDLDIKVMKVKKIVYPKIDPFDDEGKIEDLLPRKLHRIEEAEMKKIIHN